MNPKDTLGCEGPTFQVCDNCSSPNLCRVYGACPSTWPAAQIVPDPLEQQVAEMYERMDQQQREIDDIIGSDAGADDVGGVMTPNQLPPMPEPDGQMTVTFGLDEKRKVPVFFSDRLTAYALATLAQQAQEPVWANDYVTKVHAQIEHLLNDLITTQVSCNLPYFGVKAGMLTNNWVSALKRLHAEYPSPPAPQVPAPVDELPDLNPEDFVVDVVLKQLGGFAPVTTHGVRVTHKPSLISVVVDSERSQHRNRQLALEALRAITHHQAHPEPVDELIEALEDLMDWQVKNVALWHNRAYDRAHRAIKKHRAALQSSAPQTKGGEA